MIRLDSVLLVEGKYDKIRLSNIVDATIMTTDGFRIFKDKEKLAMLRAVAEKNGIIILTDSDSAGQFIRSRLKSYIDPRYIQNVYLPPISGKEKRKTKASAEGLLGVEGTDDEIIKNALSRFESKREKGNPVTKADLYSLGLSGDGSSALREAIKEKLSLPRALSANALLDVINILYEREEFIKIVEEVKKWVEARDKK